MQENTLKIQLPPIPAKRYFTIGEVGELCGVKPHVLRYWEQEFTQLKPLKRRGNRRYYQHHEVLLIRRIRELLYDEGFTINGARHRLEESTISQVHANHKEIPNITLLPESNIVDKSDHYDFKKLREELNNILALLKTVL